METKVSNEIQDGLMLCWLSWKQIGKAEGVKRCQLKKQPIMVSSTFYRERGCESEVKAHMEIFMGYSLLPQGVCVPDVHQLNTTHCVQFIDCENQSTKPKN